MTCVDQSTGKGEGMGELDGPSTAAVGATGTPSVSGLISVSLPLARSLLRPSHPLLPLLAQHFPFESAVGANGFVWMRVDRKEHLVAAKAILEEADRLGSTGVVGEEEEGKVGKEGKGLSARWGAGLGEKQVRDIVRRVVKGDA